MTRLFIVAFVFGLQFCYGESEVSTGNHPTLVKVAIISKATSESRLECDGSLLSGSIILTPARCVETAWNERLIVTIGENKSDTYYVSFSKNTAVGRFGTKFVEEDLALLQLVGSIDPKIKIHPVKLPASNATTAESFNETLFGGKSQIESYGHLKNQTTAFVDISSSGSPIDAKKCAKLLDRTEDSLKGRFCMRAKSATNSTKSGGTKRLIGGPAVYQVGDSWVQVGVMVSSKSNRGETFNVFASVFENIDFIEGGKSSFDEIKPFEHEERLPFQSLSPDKK